MERDLRAVKDRATSSEQLESLRARRCRKGLELSQSVMLLRTKEGCVQGSLEVGMLRDCRAVSCFGSRVDDDDGDREGEEGEGEADGESGEEEEFFGGTRTGE